MTPKYRTVMTSIPALSFDTTSLYKLRKQSNNLVTYTVLTFIIVLLIYLGTKDWEGVTVPEEVDLGYMNVPPPQTHHRRKPHHQRLRQRAYDDY